MYRKRRVYKKGKHIMEELELGIRAIADQKGMSIRQMAVATDIPYNRLLNIRKGLVRMTAEEMRKLSLFSGIPEKNIKIDYPKSH